MSPTIDYPGEVAGCPELIRQILEQIDLVSGSDKCLNLSVGGNNGVRYSI